MNGAQDMGGMQNFGPVLREAGEPAFHADWERTAFALTLAMGFTGEWTIDMARRAREALPPADYLASSYYQIWLAGLEALLRERGLVSGEEIASGRALAPARPVKRVLKGGEVSAALAAGGPAERETGMPARFAVGDRVRTRTMNPTHHTRLPRYARNHAGEIVRVHGAHVFPDTNAHGLGEDPRWLYTVRFSARELWGEEANPRDHVHLDLWEPYLEPA